MQVYIIGYIYSVALLFDVSICLVMRGGETQKQTKRNAAAAAAGGAATARAGEGRRPKQEAPGPFASEA